MQWDSCGLVATTHNLSAVSCGFELIQKFGASDLNSLLSYNKISLLTREQAA